MARTVLKGSNVPAIRIFVLQEIDSQIDQLREELALASVLRDDDTKHLVDESARARRNAGPSANTLRRREEERAQLVAALPVELVAQYDHVRRRVRSGPWVVGLLGAECRACNLVLPSRLRGDAERTGDPVACPSCGRLLVWQRGEATTARPRPARARR